MANVATVMTAALLQPGVVRGQVTADGLLQAMTHFHGRSHCVPTWSHDDYLNRCIYTQHGEKWSPTGVVEAWERYGQFLQAIWVRWYDSGGDHDAIFRYDPAGYRTDRWCRYGFDEVRIRGVEGLDSRGLGDEWRQTQPGVWAAGLRGSYVAANDRCDLLADHPSLPGPTTPVRGHVLERGTTSLHWPDDDVPAAVAKLESVVLSSSHECQFLWCGRVTRIYQRRGEWWWTWCLDDWDNCVDVDWLASQHVP